MSDDNSHIFSQMLRSAEALRKAYRSDEYRNGVCDAYRFMGIANESAAQSSNSDWVDHHGSESPPIADDVTVWKIRYRDGIEAIIGEPPSSYVWRHHRNASDIVAFMPLVYLPEAPKHPLYLAEWIFGSPEEFPVPETAKCWQACLNDATLTPVFVLSFNGARKWGSLQKYGRKITAYRFK